MYVKGSSHVDAKPIYDFKSDMNRNKTLFRRFVKSQNTTSFVCFAYPTVYIEFSMLSVFPPVRFLVRLGVYFTNYI